MTLTAHALGGAATALVLRAHPVAGLCAAFTSHFILDAVPHWDHPLRSLVKHPENYMEDRLNFRNPKLVRDVIDTAIDGLLGLAAVGVAIALTHPQHLSLALTGAALGIFPDALQVLYFAAPRSPLRHLQRLHRICHAKTNFDRRPQIGVPMQLIFAGLLVAVIAIL